ncbi:MAG: YraN family protein [Flavobacteriaceae bacterium]
MTKNQELGRKGEDLAAAYLTKLGYSIIRRNYRYLKAEVDIIAQKGEVLAMVEVKSRNGAFYQNLSDTISKKKRKLIVMAADHFVQENALDIEVRFDIITVVRTSGRYTIEHISSAFYHF